MTRKSFVAIAAVAIIGATSVCVTVARAQSQHAAAVNQVIDAVFVNGYRTFYDSVRSLEHSLSDLCANPGADALAASLDRFRDAVRAFGTIEMIRFGPVQKDNRYERLLFWPDRRGRGRKQVEKIIATEDELALGITSLQGKSVAVQGLLALDYVLAGKGSGTLSDGSGSRFRCEYGTTIANAMAIIARETLHDWTAPDGYGALMRSAGPDNPVYRSHKEALNDIIGSAGEMLTAAHDLKLARVIGASPEAARPKRAAFWRSGAALDSVAANLAGVEAILAMPELQSQFSETDAAFARKFVLGIGEARLSIRTLADSRARLQSLVADPRSHQILLDATARIGTLNSLFNDFYYPALGLTAGFNSFDGD